MNTTSAVLLNTGNLALTESPSSNVKLRQSFDYPTDVVLPGAKFGRNKVTGFNRQAITKKSIIDLDLGSYKAPQPLGSVLVLGIWNINIETHTDTQVHTRTESTDQRFD
uniref:non-specific serine/threonine protein kinase n=1 Tax=Arundo donax TaxID=35708 RepID=A0A0A9F812_ARUDO